MRIAQSQVALASQRTATVSDTSRSTMQAWAGDRPRQAPVVRLEVGARSTPAAIAGLTAEAVAESSRRAIAASTTAHVATGPDMGDPAISDPKLSVLIALIERMTGHKIHLLKPGDLSPKVEATAQPAGAATPATAGSAETAPQPQNQGWGVEVHVEQIHQETETTAYTATGQVTTTDGQTIAFEYQLAMHRDLTQRVAIDIEAGDAVKQVDPVALNLTGGPIALDATRTEFDLDSDGSADKVALPAAGTYFVALDRNGNGKIDNGAELFGPATGNGFTELKALDSDGNGWIDAADTAYASLRLWSGQDASTQSLAEAGVAAIYVGQSVSTRFDLRSGSNESLGQVISSSIYLVESGQPGALQQVDLTA
jgi:hypothetical protein